MKKILLFLLTASFAFICNFSCFAANSLQNMNTLVEREYFKDGSYIETLLVTENSNVSTFASNAKTASKVITYKSNSGESLWTATIKATFVYNGNTASCNTAYMTTSIYDSDWKIPSATATKNGNKAVGKVIAKWYSLDVLVKTVEKTVTISCSADGVIS